MRPSARVDNLGGVVFASMLVGCPRRRRQSSMAVDFLDLPRHVRDRIYRLVLHDEFPLDLSWGDCESPYVPTENFGLLYASRQVYEEASPILYENVYLGTDATRAYGYLKFLGPARIQQIQNLGISYHCVERCGMDHYNLDWMPVSNLLWESWAWVRSVEITFWPCSGNQFIYRDTLQAKCRLSWDIEVDWFWSGLQALPMAEEIRILSPMPEYYAHRTAKQLGWEMHGLVGDDCVWSGILALPAFEGKLVNPAAKDTAAGDAHQQRGHQDSHWDPDLDGKVVKPVRRPLAKLKQPIMPAPQPQPIRDNTLALARPRRTTFLSLPLELRLQIYAHACSWIHKPFWPALPALWNPGIALLRANHQIAAEALPAVYHTLRIPGGDPLGPLVTNFFHPQNLPLVRTLEINFTCFCSSADPFRRRNDTIHATLLYGSRGVLKPGPYWPPRQGCGVYSTEEQRRDIQGAWAEALERLAEGLRESVELVLTVESCCRWAELRDYRCAELEGHFGECLARSEGLWRAVDRVELRGDVPPSWAVRLARGGLTGSGLSVRQVDTVLGEYMKDVEAERAKWERQREGDGERVAWDPGREFPGDIACDTDSPGLRFVLVREGSARGTWMKNIMSEYTRQLPKGMEWVTSGISGRGWEELAEFMDYDGKIAEPVENDGWW